MEINNNIMYKILVLNEEMFFKQDTLSPHEWECIGKQLQNVIRAKIGYKALCNFINPVKRAINIDIQKQINDLII